MDIKTKNVNATKTITSRPAYITLTNIKTADTWTWLNGKKSTKTTTGIKPAQFKNKKGEIVNIEIKKMVLDYIDQVGNVVKTQIKSGDLTEIIQDK